MSPESPFSPPLLAIAHPHLLIDATNPQFTSLSILFVDLHYILCYVASSDMLLNSSTGETRCSEQNDTLKPYIAALPSLWRLMQCFRRWFDSVDMETGKRDPTQLYNAAKYVRALATPPHARGRQPPDLSRPPFTPYLRPRVTVVGTLRRSRLWSSLCSTAARIATPRSSFAGWPAS